MSNFLLVPGASYFSLALAGTFVVLLGVQLAGPLRAPLAAPARLPLINAALAAQIGGIVAASLCVLVVIAADMRGMQRNLLLVGAFAAYLGIGVVLPRRPQVQREREAAQLRRLTPGLIAFIRIALSSFESPLAMMQRYCARPNARRAAMQRLIAEAIELSAEQRMRPFAALAAVARSHECRELSDLADALASAETEGASVQNVLAAQQETLDHILQSEFKRLIRRRTMYLLLMVAISLVVGILINLLFVMTAGGTVFSQFTN